MLNKNYYDTRTEASAPPMSHSAPYNPNPQPQMVGGNMPHSTEPQRIGLNIPPMMYSVPGAVQQPQPMTTQPTAALKPMQQPPPAPTISEVFVNEERLRVRCPYCYTSIVTKVTYRSGTMTHIAAFALFVTCCPLLWIPYVADCCKDVDHGCPNCGRRIGQFKRFT